MSDRRPAGLAFVTLGEQDYGAMLAAQDRLVAERHSDAANDLVLILEHPPTYTLGRRSEEGDLHRAPEWYRERGIAIHHTPRGGRVTYHGPGQLVAYPVIDLKGLGDQPVGAGRADVAGFVATLEAAMVATLARWGIASGTIRGLTGIWTRRAGGGSTGSGSPEPFPADADASSMAGEVASGAVRKIGSVGLRISRGVTSHGISLNVSCDLEPFGGITSCGIENCRVTSILEESGTAPGVDEAGRAFSRELAELLGLTAEPAPPGSVGLETAASVKS
jgi:lipoyl(octanoyl) transferase